VRTAASPSATIRTLGEAAREVSLMIVRIARGTVRAIDEPMVNAVLRKGLGKDRPEEMLDVVFARRPEDDRVEIIVITMWTETAAIERAFGGTWQEFGGIAGLEDRVLASSVEHLDVFADDWPELIEYLAGRLQRLS
jgi:hypothetical protein